MEHRVGREGHILSDVLTVLRPRATRKARERERECAHVSLYPYIKQSVLDTPKKPESQAHALV